MALRRNSLVIGLIAVAATASSARAEDYTVNYLSHLDTITIGLGDATTSNLEIMHPTPWPSYINNTRIKSSSKVGVSALDNMFKRYEEGGSGTSSSSGSSMDMSSGISTSSGTN